MNSCESEAGDNINFLCWTSNKAWRIKNSDL